LKDDRLGKTIYADNIKLIKGKVSRTPSNSIEKAGLQLLSVDRTSLYSKLYAMGADNIITPIEKRSLDREWSNIISNKSTTLQRAEEYGIVGQENYTNWLSTFEVIEAYLKIVLDPLLMSENTDIAGMEDVSLIFEDYYTAKTLVDEQLFRAETGLIGGLDDRVKFAVEITGPNTLPVDASPTMLNVMLLQDGIDVTSTYESSEFSWQRISGDTDSDLSWRGGVFPTGKSISVSSTDLINNYATFICKFKHYYSETIFFFKTGTFAVTLEVPGKDGEDAYLIQVLSADGLTFRMGQQFSTTLTARVWKGGKEVTELYLSQDFRWSRKSNDVISDAVWNSAHYSTGGKTLTITQDDAVGKSTFNCELLILRS
jgi:hypothetical protein